MSNVLLGLAHLVKHTNFSLPAASDDAYSGTVPKGSRFETYCKDWLSLLRPGNVTDRFKQYEKAFCYQGAANNPPDAMFRGGNEGDAFEFKKTESQSSSVVLNSSFPKDVLKVSGRGLLDQCRNCEKWTQRVFYYVIGHIKKNTDLITSIWVIDGRLLCAPDTLYESLFSSLRGSVETFVASNSLKSIESVELGRLRKIDHLDKTVLRVRSMWELESPVKTFSNVSEIKIPKGRSVLHALILDDQWDRHSDAARNEILSLATTPGFTCTHLKNLQNPTDPARNLSARLIRFER